MDGDPDFALRGVCGVEAIAGGEGVVVAAVGIRLLTLRRDLLVKVIEEIVRSLSRAPMRTGYRRLLARIVQGFEWPRRLER